jgi:hypothetical protein
MNSDSQSGMLSENFSFLKIFYSFRIAVHPKNLIIAFIFVAFLWCAGRLLDLHPTVITNSSGLTELDSYMQDSTNVRAFIDENEHTGIYKGVFDTEWRFLQKQLDSSISPFLQFNIAELLKIANNCIIAVRWSFIYHPLYAVIFAVLKLGALAIAGGAICRISSLQFAKGEKPGLFEAIGFSSGKFLSFFAAPLVPLGIIFIMGILISIIGLITNIPVAGPPVLGILMPVALLFGFLATIIVFGTAAGFGLMFPVIAYEGSDCFDSTSRSFSYLFARPWRTLFYDFLAFVYGFICFLFVWFFAYLMLVITRSFLKITIFTASSDGVQNTLSTLWPSLSFTNFTNFSNANPHNISESIGAVLILINLLIVSGFVLSFLTSYFFTVNSIIYALIRKHVDQIDTSDIYVRIEGPDANVESPSGGTA